MLKKFFFVVIGIVLLCCTSCNHRVYPISQLEYKHVERTDWDVRHQIKVYYSDNEIQNEYSNVAVVTYTTFLPFRKTMEKKFLEKATNKALELGGNAIVVVSAGYYKIINEKRQDEPLKNVIYDMSIANYFKNGKVDNASPADAKVYAQILKMDIEQSIDEATSFEEIELIKNKIGILKEFNDSLKEKDEELTENIEDLLDDVEHKALKIQKKKDKEDRKK